MADTTTTKWERNFTDAWVKGYELPEGTDRERWVDEGSTNGLQLVIGKRSKTFIVRKRVDGKRVDLTIGQHLQGDGNGGVWNVATARKEAARIAGDVSAAVAATKPAPAPVKGPTLREAFTVHASNMKKKALSEVSIGSFLGAMRYLGDGPANANDKRMAWMAALPNLLDKPIAEITGVVLSDQYDKIVAGAMKRANAVNDAGVAGANRVIVNVSAAWNALNNKLQGGLGSWNPAKAVTLAKLQARRVVVDDLPGWYTRIQTMKSEIQRDGLLLALFTGLRSEDVRTIKADAYDADEQTLELPDPKGGQARAFTIPLCDTAVEIIERRIERNHDALAGKDPKGWVFPGLDNDGNVGPIADLREQRYDGKGGKARFPVEDVHSLRRTFLTVAAEVGISELDQHVLSNHSFGSASVNDTYVKQHIDHLAACATKIEAGIKARLSGTPTGGKAKRKGRAKLKAVS